MLLAQAVIGCVLERIIQANRHMTDSINPLGPNRNKKTTHTPLGIVHAQDTT